MLNHTSEDFENMIAKLKYMNQLINRWIDEAQSEFQNMISI